MVRAEKVANGLVNFAEAEMLSHLGGWQMWAAGALLSLVARQADTAVAALAKAPMAATLGLVDGQGNIDVDAATEALKDTARKRGKLEIKTPVFGTFLLGEDDFDTLRRYILDA